MAASNSFVNGVPIHRVPIIQLQVLRNHLEGSIVLQAGEIVWAKENLATDWIARQIARRIIVEVAK
jgi:hypothetical protein